MSAPRELKGGAAVPADPLRDTWLRYVAFTSDVGEAFKAQLSRRLYLGSYAVVALYGVLDATDKGIKAAARNARQPAPAPCVAPPLGTGAALPLPAAAAACAGRLADAAVAHLPAPPTHLYTASSASEAASVPLAVPVAAAVLDTALWHAAASLAIPAALINRTVWAARALMARPAAHPRLRQLAPPVAGLAMIPLAAHRIDEAVTEWMDGHFRPHLPAGAVPPTTQRHH